MRILGSIMAVCFTVMIVLFTLSLLKRSTFETEKSSYSPHVAVIDLSGVIYSSASFIKHTEALEQNKQCKAAVIRINSPGGVVGPSQEIYDAIKRLDTKIPVVISMGSLAASGGYYAALGARTIFANPGTLTASIGVIMEFMNTEKLFDWAKVERVTMKAGKLKDVGSPSRKMMPEEKEFIQSLLNDVHAQFRAAVKERRHLTDEEMEKTTDGRIMTGVQAKNAKLIDAIGGYQDAVKQAKKLAGLPDSAPVIIKEASHGLLKDLLFGDPEEESRWNHLFDVLSHAVSTLTDSSKWRVLYLSPLG
ncbi:MAG: signal peptide peptidase SppA [Proteobacteria bacterium]|nr:signal peptide peptidase SppA [Pseudomonadota bacterium]